MSYSFQSAIRDYAIVGESVVKLSKKKPLAFWNAQSGDVLLTEHAKNESILRRKLAAGFIKMLDVKMIKRFTSTFGQKELLDYLANNISIGELSVYPKSKWSVFLLDFLIDSVFGVGFDYVNQTSVSLTPNGNIRLSYDNQNGFTLTCVAGNGHPAKVPNLSPAKLHIAVVQLSNDDPTDFLPVMSYVSVDAVIDNDSQGFNVDLPATIPLFDNTTYLLARIEVLAVDTKNKKKSLENGRYDCLQVLGYRA
jgi:hypothetical protein